MSAARALAIPPTSDVKAAIALAEGLVDGDGEAEVEGDAIGDPVLLGEALGEADLLALGLGDGVDETLGDALGAADWLGEALPLGLGVGSSGTTSSVMASSLCWTEPSGSVAVTVSVPG